MGRPQKLFFPNFNSALKYLQPLFRTFMKKTHLIMFAVSCLGIIEHSNCPTHVQNEMSKFKLI